MVVIKTISLAFINILYSVCVPLTISLPEIWK